MDIRQQIKSLLKALLDWSVVNKYFSIVGWDRFRWSRSEVSCQKVVPNFFFFSKLIGKHLCGSIFFVNLQVFSLKETPAQVLSCEYCRIFKNTYFEKHLWTVSEFFLQWSLLVVVKFSAVTCSEVRCLC